MHKSRLSTFVIDCKTDDLEKATEFWTQAWVMEAPTGQRFCIVRPQRGPLPGNEWP